MQSASFFLSLSFLFLLLGSKGSVVCHCQTMQGDTSTDAVDGIGDTMSGASTAEKGVAKLHLLHYGSSAGSRRKLEARAQGHASVKVEAIVRRPVDRYALHINRTAECSESDPASKRRFWTRIAGQDTAGQEASVEGVMNVVLGAVLEGQKERTWRERGSAKPVKRLCGDQTATYPFDAALDAGIQSANFAKSLGTPVHAPTCLAKKVLCLLHGRRFRRRR